MASRHRRNVERRCVLARFSERPGALAMSVLEERARGQLWGRSAARRNGPPWALSGPPPAPRPPLAGSRPFVSAHDFVALPARRQLMRAAMPDRSEARYRIPRPSIWSPSGNNFLHVAALPNATYRDSSAERNVAREQMRSCPDRDIPVRAVERRRERLVEGLNNACAPLSGRDDVRPGG